MAQLRIAMICDMIPGQAGGSYISTVRFAERLRARGHHVIIVAATESESSKVHEYHGIPIYQFFSLPVPGSNRYYFNSFPTKRALKDLFTKEQIQVVHIMFPSYSCGVAKRAARSLGLPLIAHIHTQPENISIFFPRFLRTPSIDRLVLRYLVNFVKPAMRIICPSKLGEEIYRSLDPVLPITVISNGIDLKRFSEVPSPSKGHGQQILCVARLTKDKDPETLVRAMPEIVQARPQTRLLLVGSGPLREDLEKLAHDLGVSEAITFGGKLSDEELLTAYHESDLFVLPSWVELEGMVVLEAMACGLPVLIANAPTSASRYFVQENGLLFAPGDSADLATKALEILGNAELSARMRAESLSQVQYYDIERSTETLERVYRSVLP
ncbi:glycosyltransferase family 4 protein [soil metagenome]